MRMPWPFQTISGSRQPSLTMLASSWARSSDDSGGQSEANSLSILMAFLSATGMSSSEQVLILQALLLVDAIRQGKGSGCIMRGSLACGDLYVGFRFKPATGIRPSGIEARSVGGIVEGMHMTSNGRMAAKALGRPARRSGRL